MSTSWAQPRNYIQRYRLQWIIRLFFNANSCLNLPRFLKPIGEWHDFSLLLKACSIYLPSGSKNRKHISPMLHHIHHFFFKPPSRCLQPEARWRCLWSGGLCASPKLPCRLLCGMQTLESLNKRNPGENTWTLHLGELLFPCTILWSNLKKGYPQQNASNYFVFEMRVPRGLWWRSERAAAETHFLIPSVLCKLSLPKHSDNENRENWMLD